MPETTAGTELDRLRALGPLIDTCVHCGFCLPACPSYLLLGREADSPRGRVYLLKAALEGRAEITGGFVGHFDSCLGCMACVTACPSGVQYGPLIEEARATIERHDVRTVSDRLFRWLILAVLPHPRRLRALAALLVAFRAIRPVLQRSGVLERLPARLRAAALIAPDVSLNDALGETPERTPAAGAPRLRVGLLTGCVQRVFFGRVNGATTRVLAAEGCDVIAPPHQGCCGALALHAGFEEDARRAARRLIATFERAEVDLVAVNAAGCGSAMKDYGRLLADEATRTGWAARARRFAARVRDVTEILDELRPAHAPRHPLALRVAYHDACHLAHAQGIRRQPRELLAAIPGITLLPVSEEEICCGSAGVFNLVQPELARRLGARKVAQIDAVEPDAVVTANPGCLLQLATAARRAGRTWPLLHTIELLDASIAGTPLGRRP